MGFAWVSDECLIRVELKTADSYHFCLAVSIQGRSVLLDAQLFDLRSSMDSAVPVSSHQVDRERGWGVFLLCPKFTHQLPSLLVMYHELSSAERYINRVSSSVLCGVCGV